MKRKQAGKPVIRKAQAKLLSSMKVRRVLAEMRVSADDFFKRYEDDHTKVRSNFTPEEVQAIKRYLDEGHSSRAFRALMEALDTSSPTTTFNRLNAYEHAVTAGILSVQ